jgi:diguanylate cyclase (GGDEF)-like protein
MKKTESSIAMNERSELLDYAKHLTLLYVEDNAEARAMMLLILQEYFDHIVTAGDGLEGLKKFEPHRIDIVITDISMPNLDGLTMIKEIKKLKNDIPVLVFSAYSDTKFLHESITLGVDGYLFKPFDASQFEQVLLKTVKHIQLQKENREYRHQLENRIKEQKVLLEEKEVLIEEKTKLAFHDQLTTLYNRHGLYEWFVYALSKMQKDKTAFGLIVLDVDNFKMINDQYGHHTGDEVLRKIGIILTEQIRKIDVAARWGGEEFIILLPNSDQETVYEEAERIRKMIAGYNFEPVQHITASFGVVMYKKDESLEAFINRGDQVMYQAKKAGKNRVVCSF